MPNDSETDNLMSPRTVVTPASAAYLSGTDPAKPDGYRYVRGTVELTPTFPGYQTGVTGSPPAPVYATLTVGRVESCEFKEVGNLEEIPDGASGVEAYDFTELGYEVSLTCRFRTADRLPRMGDFFLLKGPEGKSLATYRFVVKETNASWGLKDLRKMKFTGIMHNNLSREDLVTANVAGNGAVTRYFTSLKESITDEAGDPEVPE